MRSPSLSTFTVGAHFVSLLPGEDCAAGMDGLVASAARLATMGEKASGVGPVAVAVGTAGKGMKFEGMLICFRRIV